MSHIFESFKINYKGKTHWVRAIEIPGWTPDLNDQNDEESNSEDEECEEVFKKDFGESDEEVHGENDVSRVSDTEVEEENPKSKDGGVSSEQNDSSSTSGWDSSYGEVLYRWASKKQTCITGSTMESEFVALAATCHQAICRNDDLLETDEVSCSARLIEGVIRSVNNLLEKFHQSFFLYLLTSSNKFISVGVYMIAFLLLVAPLPVLAAYLFSDAAKSNPNSENNKPFKSWRWLYHSKTIFLTQLWGAIVSVIPYFLYQITGSDSEPVARLSLWGALSVIILSVFLVFSGYRSTQWALLKSVMVLAAFIGLCLMSVINFATAEIGALLLVPMCLMIKPLKVAGKLQSALNMVLVIVEFPGVSRFIWSKVHSGLANGSAYLEFWYSL
ncbi:glycosylphosphatidylinositol anchor attachment 1 [Tanacetum coccineum]|uniref:Glycosylphosphatidylinositol anchor attachment 1 n=1 Tax=Tanacetum coccineum TaxID=301880 RepID=A0ABQ4X8W4_9ASTR